jgi:uncharacterized protein (TIGR02594 family)
MIHAPDWVDVALHELKSGVEEIPGPSHEARIIQYHRATTLKASEDEVPWCSSFVNWCVERAGYTTTKSARARSWLAWGTDIDPPAYGCVVIIKRGGGSQPGPEVLDAKGHVGFFMGFADPRHIQILGGNQGNRVSIRPYPAARVLGYRWAKKDDD